MKKSLRFAALIGICGLSWLSGTHDATAADPFCPNSTYPYCTAFNGQSCSTPGAFTACWDQYACEPTGCTCKAATLTWKCFVAS